MTTTHLILIGIGAVVLFGVSVYGVIYFTRQSRKNWSAAMHAAREGRVSAGPRAMKTYLVLVTMGVIIIGVVGGAYFIMGLLSYLGRVGR